MIRQRRLCSSAFFSLLLLIANDVNALGEYFDGQVIATRRPKAVDSSSFATLMTFFGNVAEGQPIQGIHYLVQDGGFAATGGSWVGITEYLGYIRTAAQQDTCYRATFDARHTTGSAYEFWGSSLVCFHTHSPDCGHCGPGTGDPCVLVVDEEVEE